MIVVFLDLLGFSNLLEYDAETALDNLNAFNDVIKTRIIDERSHPLSEYQQKFPNEKFLHEFVEKSSVTAFEHMISVSDSLILGGNNIDSFISQLTNFVSAVYINYTEPFRKTFIDIKKVENHRVVTGLKNSEFCYHNAFPVLFRGGISVGNEVRFFEEYHIKDSKLERTSLNVFGLTYLKSVKLEKAGKGPRLFCDSSVVDVISNKKMIKSVDKDHDIYEIVWTIEGCESTGYCSSNKWSNVAERINNKMLPAAIHLYQFYKDKGDNLASQYRELLTLVCTGIVKYAHDECGRADDALEDINQVLYNNRIDMKFEKAIMDDFLA